MSNKTCFKQVSVTLPLYKKIFDTGTMSLFQCMFPEQHNHKCMFPEHHYHKCMFCVALSNHRNRVINGLSAIYKFSTFYGSLCNVTMGPGQAIRRRVIYNHCISGFGAVQYSQPPPPAQYNQHPSPVQYSQPLPLGQYSPPSILD